MKAPMNLVVDMLDDIIDHINDVQNHQVDRGYTQRRKDFFKKVLWFIKHSTVEVDWIDDKGRVAKRKLECGIVVESNNQINLSKLLETF